MTFFLNSIYYKKVGLARGAIPTSRTRFRFCGTGRFILWVMLLFLSPTPCYLIHLHAHWFACLYWAGRFILCGTGSADLTIKINLPILLPMETAVTIDADILNKAMQTASGQTQRQLVEDALRLFVLRNRQSEVRKYRGKLQWEGSLDTPYANAFS